MAAGQFSSRRWQVCSATSAEMINSRCAPIQLRGLLIKIRGRLGECDGEEGLDAGVEVEGFTGPAGSNGLGVRMLEAVHRSQLITFCLPLAALRECEVLGQVGIIHPVVTRPSIWFVKRPPACDPHRNDPPVQC
jgi:hypothetical protein